jgi:hypothetical protein
MSFMKNKFLDKSGNEFVVGLLIVLAGIGLGTIILTYRDFQTTTTTNTQLVGEYDYSSDSLNTTFILETITKEDEEYKQVLLSKLDKNIDDSSISKNQNFKTSLTFSNIAKVVVIEEFADSVESIYLCQVTMLETNEQQLIKVVVRDKTIDMVVVDENGDEIQESMIMPLSISEQVISVIKQFYSMRG